jgi:hypothetical protein
VALAKEAALTANLTPQEKAAMEEIKQLKQTILTQDEEMTILKDMVKATKLQLSVKETEIKRFKKRGGESLSYGSIPQSPNQRKIIKSSLLPSLNDSSVDYDTFKEPSKMDKLTELSQKFRNQVSKGRMVDRSV